jgi:hypothetical protein
MPSDHGRSGGILGGMSDQEQQTPNAALADLEALFADRGITVTAEGVRAARRRRLALQREWTPQRWEALRDRVRRDVDAAGLGAYRGTSAA